MMPAGNDLLLKHTAPGFTHDDRACRIVLGVACHAYLLGSVAQRA
jgi:hypothetical protein